MASMMIFLSTPSVGRATRAAHGRHHRAEHFYPRPPWGGRPARASWIPSTMPNFYPRPPWGGRHGGVFAADQDLAISIHALRGEGDASWNGIRPRLKYFYPRPPWGGRPHSKFGVSLPRRFLSTPSVGRATLSCPAQNTIRLLFLSTPSVGRATNEPLTLEQLREIFLSTPSVGRATPAGQRVELGVRISIHALRGEGDYST